MTKKDYFKQIMSKYPLTAEEVKFVEHEIELLDKKNVNKSGEKKLTAKQKENEAYKVEILGIITDEAHTVSEILKSGDFPEDMTNQRISALLKQMIEADLVVRTEKDRKAYFKAVEVEG
jgi:hypothetical protein